MGLIDNDEDIDVEYVFEVSKQYRKQLLSYGPLHILVNTKSMSKRGIS